MNKKQQIQERIIKSSEKYNETYNKISNDLLVLSASFDELMNNTIELMEYFVEVIVVNEDRELIDSINDFDFNDLSWYYRDVNYDLLTVNNLSDKLDKLRDVQDQLIDLSDFQNDTFGQFEYIIEDINWYVSGC